MNGNEEEEYVEVGLTTLFHVTDLESRYFDFETIVSIVGVCTLGWQAPHDAILEYRFEPDNYEGVKGLIDTFSPGSYHKIVSEFFEIGLEMICFDHPETEKMESSRVKVMVGCHHDMMVDPSDTYLPLQKLLTDTGFLMAEMAVGKTLTELSSRDIRRYFKKSYSSFFTTSATTRFCSEIKVIIHDALKRIMPSIGKDKAVAGALIRVKGPERLLDEQAFYLDDYLRSGLSDASKLENVFIDVRPYEDTNKLRIDIVLCV